MNKSARLHDITRGISGAAVVIGLIDPTTTFGLCAGCGQWVNLTSDGVTRTHYYALGPHYGPDRVFCRGRFQLPIKTRRVIEDDK